MVWLDAEHVPNLIRDLEHGVRAAQVPGIDMLFFGPGDYSHAFGIPGELGDRRIDQARQRVADACIKHHKFAGTVVSAEAIQGLTKKGYRFISTGADVVGLGEYFAKLALPFNDTTPNTNTSGTYR